MKALIQRVSRASVSVNGTIVGSIEHGIVLLLGVDKGDDVSHAEKLAERILHYRIFPDHDGKMNCSVKDTGGALLVVSQFTLSADTHKGTRPSFSSAAAPELARTLYDHFVQYLRQQNVSVETGVFAADMQVSLVNDGPVTFLLDA